MIKDRDKSIMLLTTYYHIHYNKTRVYESIVSKILSGVGDRYEKEVRSLVTNSARMIHVGAIGMTIPRRKSAYTGNPQKISYKRMMELLDLLDDLGYVSNHIGGAEVLFGSITTKPSITEFHSSWLEMFDNKNISIFMRGVDDNLIEIRDRVTKKLKSTRGIDGVKKMRSLVEDYNKALSDVSIEYDGVPIAKQSYKRVFTDNITSGGRWYNRVGGVQLLGGNERKKLTIDGESLVELDFSAMHPRMILQGKGKQGVVSPSFCPYSAHTPSLVVCNRSIEWFKSKYGYENYNPVRNLLKLMVMIGLNAKDDVSGIFAVASKLGEDKKKVGTDKEHECKYFGLHNTQNIRKVFEEVLDHNWEIAETFFADNGVYLQYKDSQILERVVSSTLQDGEVLLPWHDGYLCKKHYKDKMYSHMREAWIEMFGDDTFCKISVEEF